MRKGLYELKNKSGKIVQKKVNAIPFIMFYMCNSICIIFIAHLQCYTLNEQDDGKKTGSDGKEDGDENNRDMN